MNKHMDRRDFMKKASCATSGLVISEFGLKTYGFSATTNNNKHFGNDKINLDGLGHVVLQKNKSIADQMTKDNTVYEVCDYFDLQGKSVKLPTNCVLKYEGGILDNGTLIGSNTSINAQMSTLFGQNITMTGTWRIREILPEWFGAKGDGKTDDIKAIQKAIDICGSLKNVNTVFLSNGDYLINTPINLNSTSSISRHNICLKGGSMPFTSVGKGVRIIGNTGGAIIEAIDSVNCIIENVALTSSNGTNPSTIGLVVARGEQQYVAKFSMRNSFVDIGFHNSASRKYNNGFGSIGLIIIDAEESILDNVEICANLCVGISNSGKIAKYSVDDKGVPQNKEYYLYKPYFNKKLSFLSNTVYRFTNCRLLSKGKISPAVYIGSTSDANFINCFFQTTKWENNNGNVNYAMLIGALRNSNLKATFEGYGTAIVCDSEISNCDIRMVIDGRDQNGLIHIVEPDEAERIWYNNNISITSNTPDKPLFVLTKNNSLNSCLIGLINNNISCNTKDQKILPGFDILKRDNNVRLSDVSYLEAGRFHGRILSDNPVQVVVDESKYYHLWDYIVGADVPDNNGSSCNIVDMVTCLTANTGSPAPSSYGVRIDVEIMNLSGSKKPDFRVNYSYSPIHFDSMYAAHQIEKVEPIVVFDNNTSKISCFIKMTRKIPSNSMRSTITQVIEYNGTPVRQGRQILIAKDVLSSLKDYPSKGSLKNLSSVGSSRPLAPVGFCFFDTSLSPARPVWYNGKDWVDATGKVV